MASAGPRRLESSCCCRLEVRRLSCSMARNWLYLKMMCLVIEWRLEKLMGCGLALAFHVAVTGSGCCGSIGSITTAPSRVESQDGIIHGGLQCGVGGDAAGTDYVEYIAAVVLSEERISWAGSVMLR